ncbi:conserved hypothetical protein [Sulfolobus islandicus Y.G.57.14]|uniref:Uncharacterized protein n=1 Tax=Saccharolobus islandicus (strain Y.G.57.14 / Yellowstone \|nr:hypothetical protein [Sulfolobus islandicus]ACP44754.1 conserved hypothetical protein [Sulfolobus islandicus Y.G.57.14]
MDVKYILVVIIIIMFIVNLISVFYLNSQISILSSNYNTLASNYNTLKTYYQNINSNYSTLYSSYSTLVSSYNSLSSKYNTLSSKFATLMADYNNLSANYSSLSQNYTILSAQLSLTTGIMTVQSFYIYLAQLNTQGMESLLVGPMTSYFQITSPPGNGTVIFSSSNSSTALPAIGAKLSQFFDYVNVKIELKELVVTPLQNYVMGQGLVSFNNQYGNGTIITNYALITVVAEKANLTTWQIVYVKIDNSISQGQYTTLVTLFNMLQALESKNIGELQSILVGAYPSHVYIAQGPYAGNYSGLNVPNVFIGTILSKDIKTLQFSLYYFNITPINPTTSQVDMYGILSITLLNGSTYTFYTDLHITAKLQPNGVPQVVGLDILNDLTQGELISVVPK